MTDRIVNQMISDAQEAAQQHKINLNTQTARAAYAKGIRDMASIVSACADAAQKLCDEQKDSSVCKTMLQGYANGLRHIVRGADDMIPPGYEP